MPISSNIKSSKMNFLQHPRVSRAPSLCHLWLSPGASGDGRSGHCTDTLGSKAEAEDCGRWGPAARAGCPAGAAASPGQLGNYWATLSPPAGILA